MAIEREIDDARNIRDASASEKNRENRSYSSSGKKQRTYASCGFQGQGRGYQGQGQVGASSQMGANDMLSLPPAWTHETRLPIKAGIPELWDTSVPIISGTCTDTVCLSLPQHGPREPISVRRCGTCTSYFTNRLERPGLRLRSGAGLTGWDFGDPRACLRHYTSD